jgi:hypothetical protein
MTSKVTANGLVYEPITESRLYAEMLAAYQAAAGGWQSAAVRCVDGSEALLAALKAQGKACGTISQEMEELRGHVERICAAIPARE